TVALALHAVIFGPLAAFISEQFGTGSRYTGASMGYQLATLIGAGFTPTILASLYAASGGTSVTTVTWYLVGLAVISGVAIILTRESKNLDLETHEH
ncbi:MAG TPA: MFS transporter, partial [Candidatus Yaniella excrementavium]|nr:MFS transporter [Candidatus Yaniella excrementavium]